MTRLLEYSVPNFQYPRHNGSSSRVDTVVVAMIIFSIEDICTVVVSSVAYCLKLKRSFERETLQLLFCGKKQN